jgi:hypothetical protein
LIIDNGKLGDASVFDLFEEIFGPPLSLEGEGNIF